MTHWWYVYECVKETDLVCTTHAQAPIRLLDLNESVSL